MSDAWNQRLRMIRFRRKRERSTFREELRILPKWLVWTCVGLYILALIIGTGVNLHNMHTSDPIFPDDSLRGDPVLSCLGLAGVITLMATFFLGFHSYARLRLSRRQATRHERGPVDPAGPDPFSGIPLHRLDHLPAGSRAVALCLPSMRGHCLGAVQFLPQL